MDFFGGIPGFQTGQVMGLPRLLVAFARIEGERTALEVGQDHVILAPRDPDVARRLRVSAAVPLGQPLSARAAGARRALADVASACDGRHRRADWRRSRRRDLSVRASGARRRAIAPSRRAGARGVHRGRGVGAAAGRHRGVRTRRLGAARRRVWRTAGRPRVDFAARRDVIGVAGELFVGDNADAFGGATGLDARERRRMERAAAVSVRAACRSRRALGRRQRPRKPAIHAAAPARTARPTAASSSR